MIHETTANPPALTTGALKPCRWCGPNVLHYGLCPRVKSIEYHPTGYVKRVEFWGTAYPPLLDSAIGPDPRDCGAAEEAPNA